jgi:adenylosuccinate lyase
MSPTTSADALSPLDGRYRETLEPLRACFSERALVTARVRIEIDYLKALLQALEAPISPGAESDLVALATQFGPDDFLCIKALERTTNHDIKAVEYFLRERLQKHPELTPYAGLVHLGLTSEDINNLAWSHLTQRARHQVLLPALRGLIKDLSIHVAATANLPMLARTHGQAATPTTLGKELAVFLTRLITAAEALAGAPLAGKLGGATGTMGALKTTYPAIDWLTFSDQFVRAQGLEPLHLVTQIEPHDHFAALFDAGKRFASILLDMNQDLWRYISDGWLGQKVTAEEVGSSAMPHKVNPIDFENSEGNLGLAIALFEHLARKLPVSRLQRDLSDSTVLRNQGVAWGHWLLGVQSARRGLSKIAPAPAAMRSALAAHPEVLSEAFQVALRAEGHAGAYEDLKALTRGVAPSLSELQNWLLKSPLSEERKAVLLALTPETYVGEAPQLAKQAVAKAEAWLCDSG